MASYTNAEALRSDPAARAEATVQLKVGRERMPSLATDLGDLRLPALRALEVDDYGAATGDVVALFSLPLLAAVERLTLAGVTSLRRARELLAALGALSPSVVTVDLRFGLAEAHCWQVIAARGPDGRFTALTCVAHRRPHDGYGNTKIVDVVSELLDHLPSDAITSFTLRGDDVRCTTPDVAKVLAALGRQSGLGACDVAGTTTVPAGAAAPPPAEVRKADARAAVEAAFAALREHARAVSPAIGAIAPGDLGGATVALEAEAAARAAPSAAWGEIALRVIELPIADEALTRAALRVLERARPRGTGARVVAVFGREDGCRAEILAGVSAVPTAFVPPEEFDLILDWYESIPDGVGAVFARKGSTNAAFHDMVRGTGDDGTRRSLTTRLGDGRKLSRFVREAYEKARGDLAVAPRRAKTPEKKAATKARRP